MRARPDNTAGGGEMTSSTDTRNRYGVVLFIALTIAGVMTFQGSAQAPAPNASVVKVRQGLRLTDAKNPADQPVRNVRGTFRWNIFENQRLIVDARTYAPGERTDVTGRFHNEGNDVATIMLTPGNVEMIATGEEMETGYFEAGHTWWWQKSPPGGHSIANVGREPFTFLNVRLKEPSPWEGTIPGEHRMTGCLQKGSEADTYVVSNVEGGGPVIGVAARGLNNLPGFVGKKVEVTGTDLPAAQAERMDKRPAKAERYMTVTAVRFVSMDVRGPLVADERSCQ
jgi:hypothetical protein